MSVSSRHSLVDTYEISYRNEYASTLNASAPYSRKEFLELLSQRQLDELYSQYYDSINKQIQILKEANSPIANLAEDFLVEFKRTAGKSFSIGDINLLDLLYETNNLIKTPYLNQDNNINPAFQECAERYQAELEFVKKSAKYKTLAGVANALFCGLIVAAITGLAVWTFGIAGVTAGRTIAIATLSSTYMFGFAVFHGVSAGGLFSDASHLKKLASKMEPLAALGNAAKNESAQLQDTCQTGTPLQRK